MNGVRCNGVFNQDKHGRVWTTLMNGLLYVIATGLNITHDHHTQLLRYTQHYRYYFSFKYPNV